MSSRTARDTQALIARALCEVLDTVVSPSVRESVIDDALAAFASDCHSAELPVDPTSLQEFIHGPLRHSLIQAVGNDFVDNLTVDLERIVMLAARPQRKRSTLESPAVYDEPRKRRRSSRPRVQAVTPNRRTPVVHPRSSPPRASFRSATTPRFPSSHSNPRGEPSVPPISSGNFPRGTAAALAMAGVRSSYPPQGITIHPLVAVASHKQDLARRLAKSLEAYVDIITVNSVIEVVREVGSEQSCRVVLLLDCQAPSVRPQAIAALAEDLPSNVQVVLWGATPELRATLVAISPRCQTWIGIDLHTDVEDLAGRCAILVC